MRIECPRPTKTSSTLTASLMAGHSGGRARSAHPQHGRPRSGGARMRAARSGEHPRSVSSSSACRSIPQSCASSAASSAPNPAPTSRPRRHSTTGLTGATASGVVRRCFTSGLALDGVGSLPVVEVRGRTPAPPTGDRDQRGDLHDRWNEPPADVARRRRVCLARHALAGAARQRRARSAHRRRRGDRRDLQPDHLRQGHQRFRPYDDSSRRRRARARTTARNCSSLSHSTMSATPPTCRGPSTRPATARDGFVSFECTPDIAHDTAATMAQAL